MQLLYIYADLYSIGGGAAANANVFLGWKQNEEVK